MRYARVDIRQISDCMTSSVCLGSLTTSSCPPPNSLLSRWHVDNTDHAQFVPQGCWKWATTGIVLVDTPDTQLVTIKHSDSCPSLFLPARLSTSSISHVVFCHKSTLGCRKKSVSNLAHLFIPRLVAIGRSGLETSALIFVIVLRWFLGENEMIQERLVTKIIF